jgi:hypothetical protein
MNTAQLVKILKTVGQAHSTQWKTVMEIVECLNGDKPVEIKKLTYPNKPEYFNIKNIYSWSTFDLTCIEIVFYVNSNKLNCIAYIYNGNNFGGTRKNLRFSVTIEFPDSFIHIIEPLIINALEQHLEQKYEEFLEKQKNEWIEEQKEIILFEANN